MRVKSLTEDFDTATASGRLMLTLLSGVTAHPGGHAGNQRELGDQHGHRLSRGPTIHTGTSAGSSNRPDQGPKFELQIEQTAEANRLAQQNKAVTDKKCPPRRINARAGRAA